MQTRAGRALLPLLLVLAAPAAAAPPDAVPVFCEEGVGVGGEDVLTCRRADARASFSAVPADLHLHVTDVVVTRNNASTSGSFAVLVGRDDADGLPTLPRVDVTGEAVGVEHLRAKSPRLVLAEGESLSAANLSSSDFPVDVRASGFLAATVRVPAPGPAALALRALASLGLLTPLRSRSAARSAAAAR